MSKRRLTAAAAMLVVAGLVTASAEGDILKFDFGRKDRPKVMEGFTAVTVHDDFTDAKGFGWIGVTGQAAAGWLEERRPLAGCLRRCGGQQCAVDDLACDYVGGGGKFAVKLPDGKYVVWMMVGDWGAYEFYPRGKYTVLAEDKVIGELDHSTYANFKADFWRHRDDVYKHNEDLFQKYVEPRFRTYKAEVDVTGGRLELQVRKDSGPGSYVGPLNAVVVFPAAETQAGEEELKKIKAARQAFFQKKYTIVDMQEYDVGDMSKEAGQRGFAAWPIEYGTPLSLSNRGGRREEPLPLTAMVSLGEMEPVVILVRPMKKDPGKFTCTVGQLRGDKGDVLPNAAVAVHVVKPWEMIVKANQDMVDKGTKQKKRVRLGQSVVAAVPYLLVDRNWFEGQLRLNRHFWLTVRMPERAPSSTYKTNVTLSGMGAEHVMPLTVTVVPVKLARAKQAISVNYSPPNYPRWFEDSKDQWWI